MPDCSFNLLLMKSPGITHGLNEDGFVILAPPPYGPPDITKSLLDLGFSFFCSFTFPRHMPSSESLHVQVVMKALAISPNLATVTGNCQQRTIIILSQISPVQQLQFLTTIVNISLILRGYQIIPEVYFNFVFGNHDLLLDTKSIASWLTSIFIM